VTSLAVFAVAAATIILWSEGNLSFMADLYNFGAQIAFFSAHLALIKHRIRFPNIKRSFKTPLNITIAGRSIPMTAVIGALLNIAVWITVILTKKEGRELGLIWLVIGLGVYVILRRHYRLPMIGSVKIKKVPTDHSTLLKMKKILVPVEHGEIETVHIAASMAQKNHAKLVLVRIQEVPESLPLEGLLLEDSLDEKKFLARVEAVAFEYHVPFEIRQVTARSLAQAVIEIAHEEQFDLIILGSSFPCRIATKSILMNAACRVWICKKDERQFLEDRNF
jgi:APA family basic amino acid/polyamine antiporter